MQELLEERVDWGYGPSLDADGELPEVAEGDEAGGGASN